MVTFNQEALDELKKCKDRIDAEVPKEKLDNSWLATSPHNWFSKFDTCWQVSNLPKDPLNRKGLLELINPHRSEGELDSEIIRKLIICIFAWGGMRPAPDSGKLAIETINTYENICLKLMKGMPPVSAYEEFYEKKEARLMRGNGPAYYTKLIFFLGDQTGLIMDQWTARSTHLLLNEKIIKLDDNKYVSSDNSMRVYQRYLEVISELKNTLGINTLAETEELIFSCSHLSLKLKKELCKYHKACSAWRKYVVENT